MSAYIKLASKNWGYALAIVATVAFLLSPWVASASMWYNQQQTDAFFPYSGVSSGGGYATTTVFTAPPAGSVFSDVQIIASPISGATSTTIGILCGTGGSFSFVADWDFDISALDPNSLYLLTGSTAGSSTMASIAITTETQCYAQMLTGTFNGGQQLLPKNVQTAGLQIDSSPSLKDKPYFRAYINEPATPRPIITLVSNISPGISTSSVATTCESSFATTTGFLDSVGSSISNGFCRVGVFLFVPDQNSLSLYSNLSGTLQTKIPFSYVYGIQSAFTGLTASSTGNLTGVVINFPNIASSTPFAQIVPTSINALSTTTISTYLPDSVRVSLLAMQRIALWLLLIGVIYRRIVPHHVMTTNT